MKAWFIVFISLIIIIGFLDVYNVDNLIYKSLPFAPLRYYDLPIWDF
ncbi:MAG: hypothetical protein ACD_50C00019G0012 [uncultured bacterium]|nr:MAG: hypothetical protein ACD_50C00019G0012 [uncultured bacterium]